MSVSVERNGAIWRLRMERPDTGNALDAGMVAALGDAVRRCAETGATALVLEGGEDVFCLGGDLRATAARAAPYDPAPVYDLLRALAEGPFVSVALVRGRATAGGVGLAAACDIVLCGRSASFGLSEMLFGLHPALIRPFLVRRVGAQKAHHLTLSAVTVDAAQALSCGLADAVDDSADALLRAHLVRLRRLSGAAVARYKAYRAEVDGGLAEARAAALRANRAMFDDPVVRDNIRRYVEDGRFPWE